MKAVDGVTFQLRKGEVLGIVGESGSGKTTLGRALLRLVDPTGGTITLDGRDVTALGDRSVRALRRQMQMVFQDPHASLNPAMTIETAVGHPLRIHGVTRDRDEIRRRVAAVLERVGLTPPEQYLAKYPSDLSGGQKQRAVLARAIILGPGLLVADEPVSMLDMSVRAKILELMLGLKHDLDLTYLYITHDLATAKFFCNRVAIMYLGRIVEIGETAEIFANPRHPYTVSLLKAIPDPDPARSIPRDLPRGEIPTRPGLRSAAPSTPAAPARSSLRLGGPRPARPPGAALGRGRRGALRGRARHARRPRGARRAVDRRPRPGGPGALRRRRRRDPGARAPGAARRAVLERRARDRRLGLRRGRCVPRPGRPRPQSGRGRPGRVSPVSGPVEPYVIRPQFLPALMQFCVSEFIRAWSQALKKSPCSV